MLHAIYWFQPNPGPMSSRAWLFYGAYIFVFLLALAWGSWYLYARRRNNPVNVLKRLAGFELGIGLIGLLLVAARLAMIPGWSARAWPMLMTGLAMIGPPMVYLSRRPTGTLDSMLDLLALKRVGAPLTLRWQIIVWLLHWGGLTVWAQAVGWPVGWGAVIWVALFCGQLAIAFLHATHTFDRPQLYVSPLFPLFFAYIAAGLYLLLNLHREPFPMPLHPSLTNIWLLPFYLPAVTIAAMVYTFLVNIFLIWRNSLGHRRVWLILMAIVAVGALLWLGAELFIHRTRGVTGTDPFGYAQVAVDLIENRTPLHRFALFPHLADLSIPWAATVAQGYHLPLNQLGDAASVWPPGMSILLAVGYWLGGEIGLYVTGPMLALVAALVVGWLGWEMACGQRHQPAIGLLAAGLTALVMWSSSFEVVDRSLLPMADVSAAIFSAVMWIALLRMRYARQIWPAAIVTGLAIGLAFTMRYTQLMLVVSAGMAALLLISTWRQRLLWLAAVGGAALLAALPDIIYRWQIFGVPWANPQARELTHFAISHIFPTLLTVSQSIWHGREFGLLFPFVIAGIIWQWRQNRPVFLILTGGALAVILPQLWYEALLLRDLLPLFPLLTGWVGLGVVWFAGQITRERRNRLETILSITAIFLALLLTAVRTMPLVTRVAVPHKASFGYVTAAERAAFDHLARLTPKPAAVGAQFNGGAITLHSRRQPFYPAGWTPAELDCFLNRMASVGVPVYLLDDGPAIRLVLERLQRRGQIQPIARLDVPLHKNGGTGQLYRVTPESMTPPDICHP